VEWPSIKTKTEIADASSRQARRVTRGGGTPFPELTSSVDGSMSACPSAPDISEAKATSALCLAQQQVIPGKARPPYPLCLNELTSSIRPAMSEKCCRLNRSTQVGHRAKSEKCYLRRDAPGNGSSGLTRCLRQKSHCSLQGDNFLKFNFGPLALTSLPPRLDTIDRWFGCSDRYGRPGRRGRRCTGA
jgi:hypothetical protein